MDRFIKVAFGILLGAISAAQPGIAQGKITADGSSVNIEEKGISITPPIGWEVNFEYPGTTLVMLAPKEQSKTYQRSIQVISLPNPYYIDDLGANAFTEVIRKNFSGASAAIENYQVSDPMPVELKSGVRGYIYYAKFRINEEDLEQMHILVSSAERHFVLTYTDLARYFDSTAIDSAHLDVAWQTLGTVELASEAPTRMGLTIWMFGTGLGLFCGLLLFWRLRDRKIKKVYSAYADDNFDPKDDVSMTPQSIQSQLPSSTMHGSTHQEVSIQEGTFHDGYSQCEELDFDTPQKSKAS